MKPLFIAALLLLFCTLAVTQRPQVFYPMVKVETPDPSGNLTLSFLFHSRPALRDCEAVNGNITRVLLSECPQCRITQIQCLNKLDETQQTWLSTAALPTSSGLMANGVVLYDSTNTQLALSACQASEKQSASGPNPIKCYPANTKRPKPTNPSVLTPQSSALLLIAFAAAWFVGWLIVKYEHLHAHLSHDHVNSGPQKYHTQPTPRIGGLAVIWNTVLAIWALS